MFLHLETNKNNCRKLWDKFLLHPANIPNYVLYPYWNCDSKSWFAYYIFLLGVPFVKKKSKINYTGKNYCSDSCFYITKFHFCFHLQTKFPTVFYLWSKSVDSSSKIFDLSSSPLCLRNVPLEYKVWAT